MSIWNENVEKYRFDSLSGDINTDVLIIGGGMSGILCAYLLKMKGLDCVLVEQNEILSGVTKNTTAKITVQHGLIYSTIFKRYGLEKTQLYYQSQKAGLNKLISLAEKTDADLEMCNSVVYSINNRDIIEKEAEVLGNIGCKADICETTELPLETAGAVKVFEQAKIHPLKLAFGLAKDLKIYENTQVIALHSKKAFTKHGTITAKKIIVATHFPFINKHGAYFMKMYQHRSYVLALENAKEIKDMYVDATQDGLSFRTHNGLLLLGGGGHRTGKNGGGWKALERAKEKHFPSSRVVEKWATQDCMTLDGIPYIGQYSFLTPDLYVATGFNKWGMTSSMVAAMLLADMVCERKSEYEDVYLPSRTILHSQLPMNVFESVKGLLTPTVPRCTHLGCALKYNKAEHSWDCACHGSRFDENGKLLNNPATGDLKSDT